MNFKRKLWWAQHRTDVYKYGTILSLVLIVTISIIYFTYSKFSSSNEMTIYETTVEPFIKNDYFIASYIDGEWSNEIPGKDDGYIVDKVVCDNGATAIWDDEEWGINVRNATKKVKCSVYFIVKPIYLRNTIQELATTDITNFATDDPDNNIRYVGKDPNNYVYFNCSDYSNQSDSTCEKWRIIGVFKNMTKEDGSQADLVKIIRNDSLGNYSWDRTSNGSYSNDWSNSTLQKLLNSGAYYNATTGTYYNDSTTATNVDFTSTGLKNDATRNAIESVVWNLGGLSSSPNTSTFYSAERGTTVYIGRPTTWTGKIAIMYPSDYGYATAGGSTTNRATCMTTNFSSWDGSGVSDCKNNDYLFKGVYEWTLTSLSSDSRYVFVVGSDGRVRYSNRLYITPAVCPAAYLKSDVLLSGVGDGSSTQPYQLKLS